jgi:hypothetical protein
VDEIGRVRIRSLIHALADIASCVLETRIHLIYEHVVCVCACVRAYVSMQTSKSVPAVRVTQRQHAGHRYATSQSLLARTSQLIKHETTYFHGDHGQPKFDESFLVLVYDTAHDLLITAFDSGIGNVIGEVCLKITDVLGMCNENKGDAITKILTLNKSGTLKPLIWKGGVEGGGGAYTAKVEISFKAFSYNPSKEHKTPAMMAHDLFLQATDPQSRLRQTSAVTGPTFQDSDGAWDQIDIYLSSVYDEFHAERTFLSKYVLPALAMKCLGMRVRIAWHDSSLAEAAGSTDDVIKRISTLKKCKIRAYSPKGYQKETLLIALVGERRGRLLDQRDLNRLKTAGYVATPGCDLEWIEEAFAGRGVSMQELEVLAAMNSTPYTQAADPNKSAIICMRSTLQFPDSTSSLDQVPEDVKQLFRETDAKKVPAGEEFRRKLRRQMTGNILEYKASFETMTYNWEEGFSTNARLAAAQVRLSGLEEMGIRLYQRLWKVIRQRFSSARAKQTANQYRIEHRRQFQHLVALVEPLVLVRSGTQLAMLKSLTQCAYFFEDSTAAVTWLLGGHGSGKSALLAKMVYDLAVWSDFLGEDFRTTLAGTDGDNSIDGTEDDPKLKKHVNKLKNILRTTSGHSAKNVLRTASGHSESDNSLKGMVAWMDIGDEGRGGEGGKGESGHMGSLSEVLRGTQMKEREEVEKEEAAVEARLKVATEEMEARGLLIFALVLEHAIVTKGT